MKRAMKPVGGGGWQIQHIYLPAHTSSNKWLVRQIWGHIVQESS